MDKPCLVRRAGRTSVSEAPSGNGGLPGEAPMSAMLDIDIGVEAPCFYCRFPSRGMRLDAEEFAAMDQDLRKRGLRTWLAELCAGHEMHWAAALLKADAP